MFLEKKIRVSAVAYDFQNETEKKKQEQTWSLSSSELLGHHLSTSSREQCRQQRMNWQVLMRHSSSRVISFETNPDWQPLGILINSQLIS